MHSRSPEADAGVRTLVRSQLASAVGDGSFYVTSALFFANVLGLTATQIGGALTFAWTCGFLLTPMIGRIGDRYGLRGAAVGLSLVTSAALAAFVLAPSTAAFVASLTVYAIAQSGASAVRQALLVRLVPPTERVVVRARLQAIVNGGIAAGAGVGGLALHAEARWAYVAVFALDALAFTVSAVLLLQLATVGPSPLTRRSGISFAVMRDRPYLAAAGLNAVMYLYMPLLGVALPLYIAHSTDAPRWMIAILFAANTLGVLALQIPAARRVTGLVGAAASVRRAGLLLLAACVVFWLASAPASPLIASVVLLAAVALQVLAEVHLAAGSWEIGFALADPQRPGEWQGLYSVGVPVARAIGPVVLTSVVLDWSGPGWLVLGGAFVAASFALTPVVAWGRRTRTAETSRRPIEA
ncbi:MFS transporter [Nocardioidaceae bacterium SCSIO 66511]|nr:MFS transporter [Nocardioidaceae bacterium SCSIO 66511]